MVYFNRDFESRFHSSRERATRHINFPDQQDTFNKLYKPTHRLAHSYHDSLFPRNRHNSSKQFSGQHIQDVDAYSNYESRFHKVSYRRVAYGENRDLHGSYSHDEHEHEHTQKQFHDVHRNSQDRSSKSLNTNGLNGHNTASSNTKSYQYFDRDRPTQPNYSSRYLHRDPSSHFHSPYISPDNPSTLCRSTMNSVAEHEYNHRPLRDFHVPEVHPDIKNWRAIPDASVFDDVDLRSNEYISRSHVRVRSSHHRRGETLMPE